MCIDGPEGDRKRSLAIAAWIPCALPTAKRTNVSGRLMEDHPAKRRRIEEPAEAAQALGPSGTPRLHVTMPESGRAGACSRMPTSPLLAPA